jgi:hypothetical protein
MGLAGSRRAEQDDVLPGVEEVELPDVTCFLMLCWKVKSNSSSVFLAGTRAALIRFSPPWLSRTETTGASKACRNFSYHSSGTPPGPCRLGPGSALAAAGAFRSVSVYFLCFVCFVCFVVWCFLQPVMVMGVFWWISVPFWAFKRVGMVSLWPQRL